MPFCLCRLGESPFSGRGAVFLSGLSVPDCQIHGLVLPGRQTETGGKARTAVLSHGLMRSPRTAGRGLLAAQHRVGQRRCPSGGRESANRCGSGFRLRTAQCAEKTGSRLRRPTNGKYTHRKDAPGRKAGARSRQAAHAAVCRAVRCLLRRFCPAEVVRFRKKGYHNEAFAARRLPS